MRKVITALALALLACGTHLARAASPQTPVYCVSATSTACTTTGNPGNGSEGDPAWLAFGKLNAWAAQIGLLANDPANEVLATPDSATGIPGLRALVGNDIPPINLSLTTNGGVTGTLGVANGGTGLTAVTANDCLAGNSGGTGYTFVTCGSGGTPGGSNFELQYNSSGTFGGIALGTSGYPLLSGGSSAAPAFGQLDLTTGVTGTLPVAKGGTGLTSLTAYDLIIGNGTSAPTLVAPSATAGEALGSNGTSANPGYMTSLSGVTSVNGTAIPASASLAALGTANTWTATQTFSGAVLSGVTAGTSPVCPNGTGGALTTTGCTGGSMTWPATAGIPVYSGSSSWGTSINGGSDTLVGNAGSGQAALTPAQAIGILGSGTCDAQTGTTYTLVIGDANSCTTMSNASANTLTMPPNSSVAFPVGTTITVQQAGTGFTTVTPGSGVTFESAQYGSSSSQGYPLGGEYGSIQLYQVATNTWIVTNYNPGPGGFSLSGTCTTSASSGDAHGGTATLSSAGPCTLIVTPSGVLPAVHAWLGFVGDQTQPYNPTLPQASSTTTAITFDVPTASASSDVVSWTMGAH